MFEHIKKRDGSVVIFDSTKIMTAITKAGTATGELGEREARKLTLRVLTLAHELCLGPVPGVEEIQDIVERVLLDSPFYKTAKAYILYRLNVLDRALGKRLLCEMTKDDILSCQTKVFSEFSAVTSNRSLFVIKQVFKQGLQVKSVFDDPSAVVSYPSEKEHERNQFLLPSDLDRLVEASGQTRAKFYMPALIYLGAEHGASRQEALSLKWPDINFSYGDRGIIRLFRTKYGRERTEYLMPRTKKALLGWREHQGWTSQRKKMDAGGSDLVFCRLNGKPIKRFDKAWRATCKIAGLDDFHFYDLRHTFCSNLLLSGSDLKEVKEMIGHRDLSMTDRYTHLTLDHKRFLQDKLLEHYANGG
ncbi:MAG: tyrosine-type recombinase/integrase [Deltaproteobacteria bacterium]|nr:tyrosine-type recombinase/integrase [Deltaproteobacteria bacterium]MBW1910617.1 tyrosine-type recombinase/integrase [Deltaproteobacteria bacterium]MBW2034611.1 tyrosine-type recombinase/integrase [Deltaproteobacteria bacterium]MBW2115408.1 tyrosine-type recombinase/integrase [Deltaproteobacteria bacterium]MBW2168563.1 tyrosine-type recombinase/integrase [Deltaproteobacteria bacterium]